MKILTKTTLMTAILAASMSTLAQAKDVELVVVSWGGAYTKSQQKAYSEPFMKANPDIKVLDDDSSAKAASKLRAQAEAGKVTWDVVDVLPDVAIALCDEGLALEINPEKYLSKGADGSSVKDDFGDALVSPCFIPEIVYSTTFGYRTDKFKGDAVPTVIADVFDLKKFPGKRALQKSPIGNLEWALIADGVAIDKVYEELATEKGVKRAFKKLDTIKKDVVWWTEGAQPGQLLADGEVVMASAYNGRLFSAIVENKQPVAMMWDAQLFELDGFIIPKDAPNKEAALAYVKFATSTQPQADQAKYISYGPARKSSAALVGKHAELGIEMAPHMPTAPENAKNVLFKDIEFWADHKDELAEKFEAWLAKS